MHILVYADEGVAQRSLRQTVKGLNELISDHSLKVKTIRHTDLLNHSWEQDCALIVFPGGRDIPYHDKLNGKGNARIKEFVENGGSFLGICAGAYYGSGYVEFEKGYPLEVCGSAN